jgi:hypothetical protein
MFTSSMPMVGGFLQVPWLLPPLKLVAIAEILLKGALDIKNQIKKSNHICNKDS